MVDHKVTEDRVQRILDVFRTEEWPREHVRSLLEDIIVEIETSCNAEQEVKWRKHYMAKQVANKLSAQEPRPFVLSRAERSAQEWAYSHFDFGRDGDPRLRLLAEALDRAKRTLGPQPAQGGEWGDEDIEVRDAFGHLSTGGDRLVHEDLLKRAFALLDREMRKLVAQELSDEERVLVDAIARDHARGVYPHPGEVARLLAIIDRPAPKPAPARPRRRRQERDSDIVEGIRRDQRGKE